jgi:hypothetical protein
MFLGTIAHCEVRSKVEIVNVFRADKMRKIHDIMFVCFCCGRTLNRADSKHSVMTLTRIQRKMYFNLLKFRISKDIVWAYGFNMYTCNN